AGSPPPCARSLRGARRSRLERLVRGVGGRRAAGLFAARSRAPGGTASRDAEARRRGDRAEDDLDPAGPAHAGAASMRARAFAVTALCIAGCAPGARLTELRVETDVPGVIATRITAFDGECGHAIPEDAVSITGIERLPAGEWAILVEGISDDCRVLASHCERVQLPTDAPLEVTLALVQPEPACGRELICDGAGECVPCDESCAAPRIETGGDFACVIDPHGRASCWGNDAVGQLPGVEGAQSRAVGVSFLDGAGSFSFGHQTGCAVGADG